jgi:plasmid stabilization system protein ParE
MSYVFVNRPAVKADIINAFEYYRKISPKLAKQFLFRITEAKTYIAQVPLGFRIKYKNVRTLLLKQFPFHIHYIINDDKQQIVIIAIVHAYKNPQDYSNR